MNQTKVAPGQIWVKVTDEKLWGIMNKDYIINGREIVIQELRPNKNNPTLWTFKYLSEMSNSFAYTWNAWKEEELIENFKLLGTLSKLEKIIFNIKEIDT